MSSDLVQQAYLIDQPEQAEVQEPELSIDCTLAKLENIKEEAYQKYTKRYKQANLIAKMALDLIVSKTHELSFKSLSVLFTLAVNFLTKLENSNEILAYPTAGQPTSAA